MQRVICSLCKREVNGRKPANMVEGVLWPYRHLPPAQLGQKTLPGCGWFGHGRWCRGSWMHAQPVKDAGDEETEIEQQYDEMRRLQDEHGEEP